MFLALPVVLGLVLSACGGGGSGATAAGKKEEAEILSAIEATATNTDPAACKELATQHYFEQTEFTQGSYAVISCEEDALDPKNDSKSVEVAKVMVDGPKATADATFRGGTFDGQTLSVALINSGGKWKLAGIVRFAKFDQERLAGAYEKAVSIGEGGLPKALAPCVGKGLRELPQTEFEEVFLTGNSIPLFDVLKGCQGASQQ